MVTVIRIADSSFEKMASQDGRNSKEAGSVTRVMRRMPLKRRKTSPQFATVNGVVTDMVRIVTGLGALSSSKILSG